MGLRFERIFVPGVCYFRAILGAWRVVLLDVAAGHSFVDFILVRSALLELPWVHCASLWANTV